MKRIFLYTSIYPYSIMAESFLGEELRIASQMDCELTIIPIGKDSTVRELPEGIRLDNSLCDRTLLQNVKAIMRMLKPRFLKEMLYNPKRPFKLAYLVDTVKYLFASNLVYYHLCDKAKKTQSALFYSYWTSYTPIAFAEYKRKHPLTEHRFICRAHTFASFGPAIVNLYYPMRDYVFKYVDQFYVISSVLMKKLHEVYPQYINKFQLSRLGVVDNASCKNKVESECIELLSCSSVIPLKRVSLIFESICHYASLHPEQQYKWTHIGSGPLMKELEILTKETVNNLIVELKGAMPNEEILKLYREKRFHTLILLSIREGLPVVLMEAISSGIPVLATNVGGISDLVNDQTGRMVERDFSKEEFSEALHSVLENYDTLSKSCHEFYLNTFCSDNNYRSFYKSVLSLQ